MVSSWLASARFPSALRERGRGTAAQGAKNSELLICVSEAEKFVSEEGEAKEKMRKNGRRKTQPPRYKKARSPPLSLARESAAAGSLSLFSLLSLPFLFFSPFYRKRVSLLYSTTPHLAIRTSALGLSIGPTSLFSILLTTSAPSSTFPKMTCLPSSQGVGTVVMKN